MSILEGLTREELRKVAVSLYTTARRRGGSKAMRQWANGASPTARQRGRYTEYREDPVGFAKHVLGLQLWSKQVEILEKIRDGDRTSIKSCHGIGKTFILAVAALWFLYTRPGSIVLTTAPTWRQVKELLWRELRSAHSESKLPGRANLTELRLDIQWFALGLSTDDPDRFQGFHPESGSILVLVDEAAGVHEAIFDAIRGVLTSGEAKLVLVGNPTSTSGEFHRTHNSGRGGWATVSVSAFDTPNFTGEKLAPSILRKLISRKWAEQAKEDWGEENPVYQARVLARFPAQAVDSLFSLTWLEAAKVREFCLSLQQANEMASELLAAGQTLATPTRWIDLSLYPVEAGMDVARHGACENVVYIRQGPVILAADFWRGDDLNYNASRADELCRLWGVSLLRVDATGMGWAIVDILRSREDATPCVGIEVGTPPQDRERYTMLRDEIACGFADRCREGEIMGLTDDKTIAQLVDIKRHYDARGKIKIESKTEMEKRGTKSPDRADALFLAFMAGGEDAVEAVAEAQAAYPDSGREVDPWSRDRESNMLH